MASQTVATRSTTFTLGWIALLVISTLATLNHLFLMIFFQEDRLFLGWAAFNAYSTLVLALPFRRREPWAWYTSWVLVIGFAVPLLLDPTAAGAGGIAVGYLIAAGVMAVGLLLTRAAFFPKHQTSMG